MIEYPEIFISHSHDDTDAVRRIVRRWRSWKLSVYADYLDPKLSRAKTMTGPLADHLRKKIHESLLFVFVASQQSVGSGWMPWSSALLRAPSAVCTCTSWTRGPNGRMPPVSTCSCTQDSRMRMPGSI